MHAGEASEELRAGSAAPPVLIHGRGAASNPANRFTRIELEPNRDAWDAEGGPPSPATSFWRDTSGSIIATNDSPDVGFEASVNPYRGCEHGCAYCYARPTHEYFGLSAGLDFETRILVKEKAPELLDAELSRPSWTPKTIALSGVTDPYQPVERKLGLTRRILEVLRDHMNPVVIVTKNHLVTRDRDILAAMSAKSAAAVMLSIPTLDSDLAGRLEPRAARPEMRLKAITELREAGVPCGVMAAPVIPGLTDHELPAILEAAAKAGATHASWIMLRLPLAVAELFSEWLTVHEPGRREKVLNRLRSLRGGELNDPRFGARMKGEGVFAAQVRALFEVGIRRAGLAKTFPELSSAHFRRDARQLGLFEE
jgi:DNA repair photolyase